MDNQNYMDQILRNLLRSGWFRHKSNYTYTHNYRCLHKNALLALVYESCEIQCLSPKSLPNSHMQRRAPMQLPNLEVDFSWTWAPCTLSYG